jgi:hypothetical protein
MGIKIPLPFSPVYGREKERKRKEEGEMGGRRREGEKERRRRREGEKDKDRRIEGEKDRRNGGEKAVK